MKKNNVILIALYVVLINCSVLCMENVPKNEEAIQREKALEVRNRLDEFDKEAEKEGNQELIKGAPVTAKNQPNINNAGPIKTPTKPRGSAVKKIGSNSKIPEAANVKNLMIPEFNEQEFSEDRKKEIVDFVEHGAEYLQKNPDNEAFSAFTFDKEFINGELYLFVFDKDGFCLAHGQEEGFLWQNLIDLKDRYGNYIVRMMIDKAQNGGGWITYQWNNSTKVTYVKQVIKEGKAYTIGAGFYPDSKRDACVSLVRGAVEYFKKQLKGGNSVTDAMSTLSYPLGSFVLGDLYLFALDFEGNIMAQGDRPGLIGQNAWGYQDADGKYINREIVEKLKNSAGGVWTEYTSKRARKITYAEKVTDDKGKNYFIASGYYPSADRNQAVDLVRRGYQYIEGHGKSQAADEFNSKNSNAFRYGDLYLSVYDMQGLCIANGNNPDQVGSNQSGLQDSDGKFIVRELIQLGKNGGGWINFRVRNTFMFMYVEQVKVGLEYFVITCGLFPISKPETLQLLVKSAANYLHDNPREKAFGEFVKKNGDFVRGDMQIFVFDTKGICYVFGDNTEFIWRHMLTTRDDEGREYVKTFINIAKQGAGIVTYKERGQLKYAYIEPVEKDGVMYIIGSSFYK